MRKFEKLIDEVIIPSRQTKYSAGYDFYNFEDILLLSGKMVLIKTHIRALMEEDEYLSIHIRSSLAINHGIILANQTGIIDKDYYDNPNNGGHIIIALINTSEIDYLLKKDERFVQGIFNKYLLVEDDDQNTSRTGGIGSTGNV